jgi:hypothetical protein
MDEREIVAAMQKEARRFVELSREWDRDHWPADHHAGHVFKRTGAAAPS